MGKVRRMCVESESAGRTLLTFMRLLLGAAAQPSDWSFHEWRYIELPYEDSFLLCPSSLRFHGTMSGYIWFCLAPPVHLTREATSS